jgi:PAS domain S-box-containing protein
MIDSVGEIHGHHILDLIAFLNDPDASQAGGPAGNPAPSFREILPEVGIIRAAAQVQNSLVSILETFDGLQQGRPRDKVRAGFEARFEAFRNAVGALDAVSLDEWDARVVEQLLLAGDQFASSFGELLERDGKRESLERELDRNRLEILGVFDAITGRLEDRSASLRQGAALFKGITLISGMILLLWFILDGTRIIKEIERTVTETRRIQEDLGYTITGDRGSFEEFQVVYQALNSMAATINTHVAELELSRDRLERRVLERTRDLVKSNQELRDQIREREKAEKELLGSRERLSLALDISGGVVWEWNQATGVFTVDAGLAETFGLGPGSFDLEALASIHDPSQISRIRRQSAALITGRIPLYTNDHRMRRTDGQWRIFRVHGKVFRRDAAGRTEALLGTAIDITDQRQMEERSRSLEKRLQQSQKMEAIGTLAGGIAHDFNNILGGILGYAQLARRAVREDQRAAAHLDQILAASNRARDLIQQILTFSRKTPAEKETCSLSTIVTEAMKLLRASIPAHIEIRTRIEPDRDAILANATQMHQVVMNLCTNAYQAMGQDGGVLEVSLSPGEVSGEDRGRDADPRIPPRHVKLTVADNGCGMDADTLTRIFDPYFTTKKSGEGIGMGLATVHGIVRDHGGHIAVRSLPGQGTVFEVFLPRTDQAAVHSSLTPGDLPFGTENILVVDDEPILTNVIKASLEDLGYQVTGVTDSVEALDLFRNDPEFFSLVILDYIMPRMKGDQLAREILAIRKNLPVFLCTGLRNPLTDEEIAATGIREIIPKPVDINVMALKVRQVLNRG